MGAALDEAVRSDLLLTIEEETQRLNRFVANLLNMTRLESGALPVTATALDAAEILDGVARRFTPVLGARSFCGPADRGPAMALGDAILLDQALGNIVENSIRFSPDGSTVFLHVQESEDQIVLEVQDEGPGVPPDDLERIFDKFYRSPANLARAQGTGLGLSISKGLIEAQGGAIRATDGRVGGLLVTNLTSQGAGVSQNAACFWSMTSRNWCASWRPR